LLARYGDKFGRGAEQHARNTYSDWQSGAVTPAGKTIEKLIELLPPFLNDTQRFDLIRKLRAHHLKREELQLATTPEQWRNELNPLIQKLFAHGAQFDLPQIVYQKATWLTNGQHNPSGRCVGTNCGQRLRSQGHLRHYEWQDRHPN